MLFDAGGRIVAANGAAEALAGRPLAGLTTGEAVRIFRHRRPDGTPLAPDDLPSARARAGGNGDTGEAPLVITAADGRTLELVASASPITDGGAVTGVLVVWRDVTDQRRAEAALRESEARFRSILDRSLDALYRRDLATGRADYYSPAIEAITGFTVEESMAMSVDEIVARVHPDDLPTVMAGKVDLAPGAAEGSVEYRFLRRDGTYCWASDRFRVVCGDDGRPLFREGVLRDITGQKRAEAALRDREQALQGIFRAAPAGIGIASRGVVQSVNDSLCHMTGYAAGELVGTSTRFLYPDDATYDAVVREKFAQIRATGIGVVETRWRRKDGAVIDVLLSSSPLDPADPHGTVVTVGLDVTDRKRSEAALARSEAEYRAIVEHAPTGIYEIDYSGPRFRRVNDAMCEILGYPREELLAMDPGALLDDESRERLRERFRRIQAGEPVDESVAFRLFARDGREIRAALNVRPLFADGKPDGALVVAHDITARVKTEEARARLADQRQLALDAAGMGWWYYDPVARTASFDDRYREIFEVTGASRPNDEILARLHPDDLPGVRARMEAALDPADPRPYAAEYRVLMPGGTVKWVEARGLATFESQGADRAATCLVGTVRDITDRKRAEETLREYAARLEASEALARQRLRELEAVYDSAPVGLCVLDRDLRFVRLNRRFAEINGVPVEAHLGRTPFEIVPDLGDQAEAALRRVLETGETVELEVKGETPADPGVARYWDERWLPVRDEAGAIAGVSISAVEVTERKRAEAALQESAATYRDLFMNDITGDFVAGADGRILDCNPAFARLFGFASVEEALASSIVGTYASPADRDTLLERIRKEGRIVNDERFRRRLDGTPVHVVENILGIFDQDGTLVRTQGYIIDDTQRHRAEAALREYAEDLRRSNEDLERYAYVSSHDLQEPLRSIVSFSQLLEKRYRGQLGQDADEYIDFIVEGGTRMQILIQDLLAYSRVNTARQEPRPTDAEAVMAGVERALDGQLGEAGATLTHDPLPRVLADPLQLEQVFANLVSNAVKFRKPDEPLRIHISARRLDGVWEFSVRDNGIGIEAEYFEKIFVIFQRLHTREAYPGTGIGLAIVKRIIDRHGGAVRVESTPGEGSTFLFTLPAA